MATETATRDHGAGAARALAASVVFLLMLFAALALWTAIPLGWIYVGSKVSETQFPAEGPYAIVVVGIVTTILIDAWLIGLLNHLYVRLTGTNTLNPLRPNWLRSMRDTAAPVGNTTVIEAVIMASVLLAAFVFVVWFFLLAGSPLPDQ